MRSKTETGKRIILQRKKKLFSIADLLYIIVCALCYISCAAPVCAVKKSICFMYTTDIPTIIVNLNNACTAIITNNFIVNR